MRTVFFAAAVMVCGMAQATDAGTIERIHVPSLGATIPYERLFEAKSEPGETMDAFALRIGPRLRAFSDASHFEACGMIATDGQRFGAVIGSNHSHIACANFPALVPAGMTSTGKTIHSHGVDKAVSFNKTDLILSGASDKSSFKMVHGQNTSKFSEADLDGWPGYLATPTGAIFHDGWKVRVVVPEPAPQQN